jgi:hypothetical protein
MIVFGVLGEETLSWDEFKLCYDYMYPDGQTWIPCGGTGALAAVADHRVVPSKTSQGSCEEVDSGAPVRKGVTIPHDPAREYFILQQHDDAVHAAHTGKSSAEGEPIVDG